MMRTKNYLLAVIAILCLYSFQSCKKNDSAPNPAPTVKPDTLTAGWNKQIISGASNLIDIFFNSSTNGYARESKSAYKSTDGGATWVKLGLTGADLVNCYVTANGNAFFSGQTSNDFFMTQDGGVTFTHPTYPVSSTPIDVFFIDNSKGFLSSTNGLQNTLDGGLTWQNITTTGLNVAGYSSLSFVNSTTGWIASQAGIYKTNGSITNWQASVVSGGSSSTFGSVYAVSATVIYASSFHSGEIFKSTDGGANFNFIKKLDEAAFTDIHFLTDQVGYASSGRSIYKTTDGGASWSKVVSLGESTITEIHFTDASHGWACGSNGVVLTFK